MPLAGQRIRALDFTATVGASSTVAQLNVTTTLSIGSPEVGVVFMAPTSGKALVTVSASYANDTGANDVGILDWRLLQGTSGAGTLILGTGALDRRLVLAPGDVANQSQETGRTVLVQGLTAGLNYYVQLQHASWAGATLDLYARTVVVAPCPA